MKTHDTPPLDQPAWDEFLSDAKRTIDARTTQRHSRRRVVRVAVATVAVVGVAVTAALVVNDPDRTTAPPAPRAAPAAPTEAAPEYTDAADVLTAAAVASVGQETAAGARYWRVESEWEQISDSGIVGDTDSGRRIFWQGHTSDGRLYMKGDVFQRNGDLITMPPASFSLQTTSFSWDDLAELTTDPAELAALLRSETAGLRRSAEDYMFTFIFELLAESPASPELRSALWEVAAGLDGVVLNGMTTDTRGRTGWSISWGDWTYLVAPETGNILETLFDNGSTTYRSTIISAGPADSAPRSVEEVRPST